jgi:hypothetical protein
MTQRIDIIEDVDYSDSLKFTKKNIIFNNMGIDSIRFVTTHSTILKVAKKLGFTEVYSWEYTAVYQELKKIQSKASYEAKKEDSSESGLNYEPSFKVFRLRKGGKNLSDYMVVSIYVDESLKEAKRQKKAKNHYCLVSFAGLHQPTKEIQGESMRALKRIMKRKAMKMNSVDVATDTVEDKKINSTTKQEFKEALGETAENGVISYQSSQYVNEPKKGNISKIVKYDKAQKQEVHHNQKLDKSLKKWKRIEVTIKPTGRMCFADYVNSQDFLDDMESVKEVMRDSGVGEYRDDYLKYQLNSFVDGRTMNNKESRKQFNSKKALKTFNDSDCCRFCTM